MLEHLQGWGGSAGWKVDSCTVGGNTLRLAGAGTPSLTNRSLNECNLRKHTVPRPVVEQGRGTARSALEAFYLLDSAFLGAAAASVVFLLATRGRLLPYEPFAIFPLLDFISPFPIK